MNRQEKLEMARYAYLEIVKSISDIESSLDVFLSLPAWIEVEGERFDYQELHIQDSEPKLIEWKGK